MTKALGVVAGTYAAAVGLGLAFERKLIFPAPRAPTRPDVRAGAVLEIEGRRGTIHALHAPAPDGAPTLVHFHGNGEALEHLGFLSVAFQGRGVGFFAVEYPGYGLSRDGEATEASIYEDTETALVYLRDALHVPREKIVLQGQSLGTGVAMEMAHRGFGARLVLISPFTSMVDMARKLAPFLPASTIVRDRFENAEKAPSVSMPALVIHGDRDDLIPVSMGRRIAELLPHARFVVLSGAHHNDIWSAAPSLPRDIVDFALAP